MPNFKKLLHSLSQQVNQKLTLRRRNLKWLSFSLMFRQLAGQLSSFYLPLFLFKVSANFEIGQGSFTPLQQGMILLSMFYLFERLVAALFSLVEANLTIKIGHEQAMLFGTLIYTLFLLTLSYVEKYPLMIFVGAFLSGIQMVFYWQSYNTLITRLSFKNSMGKNLSALKFIKNFIIIIRSVTFARNNST
jgi:MFS family permease